MLLEIMLIILLNVFMYYTYCKGLSSVLSENDTVAFEPEILGSQYDHTAKIRWPH